jgi:UDP-N-acetylmuramyl pentapeptide phosphotransferase/UDP-N-acetylglucosamine-1-phosphate transferase
LRKLCALLFASKWWVHGWSCLFVLGLFAALQLLGAETSSPLTVGVVSVGLSMALCLMVLTTQRFHAHVSLDDDLNSVQKLHESPVPRIGGLPVFIALFATLLWVLPAQGEPFTLALLATCMPVFVAGLWEDLTKRVSARQRLMWAMVSGLIACWLLDAVLVDLGLPWVNSVLSFAPVAVFFSAFAMAGMANAINIIDGLNGLASGVVCLIAIALGVLAAAHGDTLLLSVCMALAFSVFGFWLFNFPFGKIFLGDGGAYLMGLLIGVLSIVLKLRNPGVDAWTVLSIVAYPVVEVLFSIYRRVRIKAAPDQPDFAHFHQLVQRCLVDMVRKHRANVVGSQLNSNATPFLWCFCLFSLMLAFAGMQFGFGAFGFLATAIIYVISYQWLARWVLKFERDQ